MRGVDLRLALHADVLEDRHEVVAEASERLLRLSDVNDAEAARRLTGDVGQQTLDGPVGR